MYHIWRTILVKYCIGWIPHITGYPFLINRWQKLYLSMKRKKNSGFFQIRSPVNLKHCFNYDNITLIDRDNDQKIVQKIIGILKNQTYIGQCRDVDDFNKQAKWFFVFSFLDYS